MLKFINENNDMHKRKYLFRMDIVGKVFEVISCTEILASDIKIYTIHQYMFYVPSVLSCCWLGSRKGIRPVKN